MLDFVGETIFAGDYAISPERVTRNTAEFRYVKVSAVGKDYITAVTPDGSVVSLYSAQCLCVQDYVVPQHVQDLLNSFANMVE
ncbi:MAG: hypothetical protein LC687_05985 [Actinobacteria bacterium]|nr:hypothetical protein [Actinomycetota bacterium]